MTDLPVRDYQDMIVAAIRDHQVTIITAETGAGKSTQIPQYLAEAGYDRVVVTEPRILATRNLARRVREEWMLKHGDAAAVDVGYRTAMERDDSGDTKILYCTDGLQLVREITGSGVGHNQVLVIDEVHEWNENIEVLVAWSRKRCLKSSNFKVVIMSATIDTTNLSRFYHTDSVINVPGRSYDVAWSRGDSVVGEIERLVNSREKHNTLVFLPGKAEIFETAQALKALADEHSIPIIPLHSQLTVDQQQTAFGDYKHGKVILSTNIAQTSITIPDIDTVIDSGIERRIEVRDGVEGLFLGATSQADCLQRAGRAGRTKCGVYILAPYGRNSCPEYEQRPEYGVPEILRKHIDRLVLRLANIDIDVDAMQFLHEPSRSTIKQAKRTLQYLGALTHDGRVSEIGRAMEQFPLQSSYSRMLVAAQSLDGELRKILIAIIAIQEVGGIVKGGAKYSGWRRYTHQTDSDFVAQYDVWRNLDQIDSTHFDELGIIAKNLDKVRDVIRRLHEVVDRGSAEALQPRPLDEHGVIDISKCIVTGLIDQIWCVVGHRGELEHLFSRTKRSLSSGTVVRGAQIVVGVPFDLQVTTDSGHVRTLHLVQSVTKVNPLWLPQIYPAYFIVRDKRVFYRKGKRFRPLFSVENHHPRGHFMGKYHHRH